MELHRVINRDWRFSDPTTWLLAEIATIESERRYFEVARIWDEGEQIPEEFWPTVYGPPRELSDDSVESSTQAEDDALAREIAAEFRKQQ